MAIFIIQLAVQMIDIKYDNTLLIEDFDIRFTIVLQSKDQLIDSHVFIIIAIR